MDFAYEIAYLKNEESVVVGLDEAGRGAWAGPLVAGAVGCSLASQAFFANSLADIKDSKQLSAQQRRKFFQLITTTLAWSVGVVSAKEIDQIGIGPANRLAFQRAVQKFPANPTQLLIDYFTNIGVNHLSCHGIVKGDAQVPVIAAAAIVAKVYRDEYMQKIATQYSTWGFEQHKGYGTAAHRAALQQYGVSKIHRQSFKPVRFHMTDNT